MKCIFLASGKSSRCAPLENKSFTIFGGKPLVWHLLKRASDAGIKDFVIVANEDNKADFEVLVAGNDFLQSSQIVIQEDLTRGQAGGVESGLKLIDDQDSVLIMGGNDWVDSSAIAELLNTSEDWDGALLAKEVTSYFPGGYLSLEGDRITHIVEKPGAGNEPSDVVNLVQHYFAKSKLIKEALSDASSESDDCYECALQALFGTHKFKAQRYSGKWQALKFPWDVLDMSHLYIEQWEPSSDFVEVSPTVWVHREAQVSEQAVLKGPNVIIDSEAAISEFSVIQGPCYIGSKVFVGNQSLVRNSVIEANSAIGFSSEICRSYLAEGVFTHIAYLGDSVVDRGANIGAYSCTANLRLDRKDIKVTIKDSRISSQRRKLGAIIGANAQIGIGVKLMPGCKVEKEAFVRPGEVWT